MAEKKSIITDSKNRRIYLSNDLTEEKAEKVVTSLLDLEADDPTKDILLYVDSYGGYVDSAISIHDAMKMLRCKVSTVCIGKAMSAAAFILMSGTSGYRFITQNSRVMIHQVHSFNFGNVSQLDNELDEVKRLQERLFNLTIKYSKISEKKLTKIMEKDSYFTSEESLDLGIVDQIVKSNSEIYSKIKV